MFLLAGILVILLAPSLSSDLVSLNSGGNENIVIIPSQELEGFFFASGATLPVCGNGVIESGEECDDGANNGVVCSPAAGSSCSYCNNSCETVVVQGADLPGPDPDPDPDLGLVVSPTSIDLDLMANSDSKDFSTSVTEVIKVTNQGTSTVLVEVNLIELGGVAYINETSFNLNSGESKDISVLFVAPSQTGIFTGKILFNNEVVLVKIDVTERRSLFDANIVVLNKDYQVEKGRVLNTEVTLIPMGEKQRLDVTLNFEIKDFNGNTYNKKSETLLLEDRITFNRDFDLGDLPLGKYVIALELVYSEGKAPASAHFEVIAGKSNFFWIILIILMILILIILIILIIILIKRRRSKYYKVQEGDVFSGIANKLNVPVSRLKEYNPNILNYNKLNIGQKIKYSN